MSELSANCQESYLEDPDIHGRVPLAHTLVEEGRPQGDQGRRPDPVQELARQEEVAVLGQVPRHQQGVLGQRRAGVRSARLREGGAVVVRGGGDLVVVVPAGQEVREGEAEGAATHEEEAQRDVSGIQCMMETSKLRSGLRAWCGRRRFHAKVFLFTLSARTMVLESRKIRSPLARFLYFS